MVAQVDGDNSPVSRVGGTGARAGLLTPGMRPPKAGPGHKSSRIAGADHCVTLPSFNMDRAMTMEEWRLRRDNNGLASFSITSGA